MPPPVKLIMVAAPAGPRAVGVVDAAKPAPDKPVPTRTAEKPKTTTTAKKPPVAKAPKTTAAVPMPKPATPQPKTTSAPKAGGGPDGGKGTDVTNVKLDEGIDFPYPTYLQNIVNQIKARFEWDGPPIHRADVAFLIKKDGSVVEIRVVGTPTGGYAFKNAAMGAIEAAGRAMSFGKLPDGFADDVLPIVFSFDPKITGR
jgi:periplasmic protein TonB